MKITFLVFIFWFAVVVASALAEESLELGNAKIDKLIPPLVCELEDEC